MPRQPDYLHNLISVQSTCRTRSSSAVTLARPPSVSSSLQITNRSLDMHHLSCGISSLLHSVNLIVFILLLVHLILRVLPHHSHHLRSHHLSLSGSIAPHVHNIRTVIIAVLVFVWLLSGVHTAHDIGRCRTMSSCVAVIEHIDLMALFTYSTMSFVAATALTDTEIEPSSISVSIIVRWRTTNRSFRYASPFLWTSYDTRRHRPVSLSRPMSYDVVRSVKTALGLLFYQLYTSSR